MKICFCSIVTASHYAWALALFESLRKHGSGDFDAHVYVCDGDEVVGEGRAQVWRQLRSQEGQSRESILRRKYWDSGQQDEYRWAMKAPLLLELLEEGYDVCVYCDPDIFFFGDWAGMVAEVASHGVTLAPHWRRMTPEIGWANDEFVNVFMHGMYNAGVVGCTGQGRKAIRWWADACSYRCEMLPEGGFYVDQRYLDCLPVYFDGIGAFADYGIDLGTWSRGLLARKTDADGKLWVGRDDTWNEVVCVHFSPHCLGEIVLGRDALFAGLLAEFQNALQRHGFSLDTGQYLTYGQKPRKARPVGLLGHIKHMTRLRTRVLAFLRGE